MGDPGKVPTRIEEAAKNRFGQHSSVCRFQSAAGADVHGVLVVDKCNTLLVADWRVKHDGEIGFADEVVCGSLEEAEKKYARRVRYAAQLAQGQFKEIEPDVEDSTSIQLDIESALAALVDFAGERWRIAVTDADGNEIAAVAGSMIPPEGFEQEGAEVARFGISREGIEATVRFPIDPDSICKEAPDGSLSGKLPNGTSWSATPIN